MRILENFDLYGNLFYNRNDAMFLIAVVLFEIAFVGFVIYFLL
jgi:hypothetical protein